MKASGDAARQSQNTGLDGPMATKHQFLMLLKSAFMMDKKDRDLALRYPQLNCKLSTRNCIIFIKMHGGRIFEKT